jgi:hypothetical protein
MSFLESINPWKKRVQDRAARVGWAEVRAETVYRAFDDIVAKSEPDFTPLKNGLLAKMVSEDIVYMINLSAGKGGTYAFRWGVSLSFMPHEWDEKPKFHRTVKSARMDLFEYPYGFLVPEENSASFSEYMVDAMHGDDYMKNDLQESWSKVRPPVHAFFDSVSTVDGVLKKAEEHAAREWRGMRHSPDPGLVRAFALARLGRQAEAETVVNEVIKARNNNESAQGLLAALKQVSK